MYFIAISSYSLVGLCSYVSESEIEMNGNFDEIAILEACVIFQASSTIVIPWPRMINQDVSLSSRYTKITTL
jgi:hypothetical protein